MDQAYYTKLSTESLKGLLPDMDTCRQVLTDPQVDLLPLLDAAYKVRKHYKGDEVTIHIINNAQNGFCPEDCHYCAQAKTSKADIDEYPLKTEKEILAEAKHAYESGAFRYCMVFAGRGPSPKRINQLAGLIKKIKEQHPIQICVSAGLNDRAGVQVLKEAGLDRLNHNLNTSERHYPKICTTHTYQDRMNTLMAAKQAGVEMCSGIIVGMGEEPNDVIEVAMNLRKLNAKSIPVNFLVPIEGNVLSDSHGLTPEYCLRILCLFRFLNPEAEIRMAAGREGHLRSMEVMGLYPASSLFLDGYLNTKGASRRKTLRMIKDAGFKIKSEIPLDQLLTEQDEPFEVSDDQVLLKKMSELRPQLQNK